MLRLPDPPRRNLAYLDAEDWRDYDAERQRNIDICLALTTAINGLNLRGIVARSEDPANAVLVVFPSPEDATRAVQALQDGWPRIFVGNTRISERRIVIMPHSVAPEEVSPLEERLLAVIRGATA